MEVTVEEGQYDWARAEQEIRQNRRVRRASWPSNDFVARSDADGEVLRYFGDGELPQVFLPTMGDKFAEDWHPWD